MFLLSQNNTRASLAIVLFGLLSLISPYIAAQNTSSPQTAAQQNKPDLIPVVVNANQGILEISNVGTSNSPKSKLYVGCTIILPDSKSKPCAAGLGLSNYNSKINGLIFDIPSLNTGEKYRIEYIGKNAIPPKPGLYGIKAYIDFKKTINESNESNNSVSRQFRIDDQQKIIAHVDHSVSSKNTIINGKLNIEVWFNKQIIPSTARLIATDDQSIQAIRKSKDRKEYHGFTRTFKIEKSLSTSVPEGKYNLEIITQLPSWRIQLKTKKMPIVISANNPVTKKLTIPSGKLEVNTQVDGSTIDGVAINLARKRTNQPELGGFEMPDVLQSISAKSPVEKILPIGKYVISGFYRHAKNTGDIATIKAQKTVSKTLNFGPSVVGTLKFSGSDHGKPIDMAHFSQYGIVSIRSESAAPTGSELAFRQIYSGYELPAGNYTLRFNQAALGYPARVIKHVKIAPNQITNLPLTLDDYGTLNIEGKWTGVPKHMGACIGNVINPSKLGSLMGGSSPSPGRCYSKKADLLYTLVDADTGQQVTPWPRDFSTKVKPGHYDMTIWPRNELENSRTIKNIVINANETTTQSIAFPWPYIEKTKQSNGKTLYYIERKKPIVKGTLEVSLSTEGEIKLPLIDMQIEKKKNNQLVLNRVFDSRDKYNRSSGKNIFPYTTSLPQGRYRLMLSAQAQENAFIDKQVDFTIYPEKKTSKHVVLTPGLLDLSITGLSPNENMSQFSQEIYRRTPNDPARLALYPASRKLTDKHLTLTAGDYTLLTRKEGKLRNALNIHMSSGKIRKTKIDLNQSKQWDLIDDCIDVKRHLRESYWQATASCVQ